MKKEVGSMKYFPDNLREEYEYYTRCNPDLEELRQPLINVSDVFRAYFILVHFFTDESSSDEQESMLVGVRDAGLLQSALGRQVVSFGKKRKFTEPLDICATLFYGLTKNHPFSDGNKRTARLILLYQLQLYRYFPTSPKKDFEQLVISVADNSLALRYPKAYKKYKGKADCEVKVISKVLKMMVTKQDRSYHVDPTMREFCAAMEKQGVIWSQESNNKIKFTRIFPNRWRLFRTEEKNYSVSFDGWTRTVGAGTAKDVLTALDLHEQIPSYRALLSGQEPLYTLVDDFKEPLRRLKDE